MNWLYFQHDTSIPLRSIEAQTRLFCALLDRANLHFMIHLESAAFVFHMMATTPDSSGHCEPRVLSPSNGFWLAPSANQNRRPRHAGVSDTPSRAPGDHRRAPAFYNGKNQSFDLLSGFRPRRSDLACTQRRELSHAHSDP